MEQTGYMQQGINLKRLVLVLIRKIWLLFAAMLLGALLGGISYKVITAITNGETEYRASADYYITFFKDGADYYNAYTWDSILRDDPIVDYALTLLPKEITKEMVKQAVKGEMLGDYRILTVHVNAKTKEMADEIAKAYEEALWHFGQEMELLDKVELWSQEEATVYEKNTKTGNAAFLGALILTLIVLFGLLFFYCLQDAVYVEQDAIDRFRLPVYGLLTKQGNSVQQQILKENLNLYFKDTGIETWNGEFLPASEDYERLRRAEVLLLNIPWGRDNGRQIERVLLQLKMQQCDVKGIVITEAEDWFIKAYYRIERKEK